MILRITLIAMLLAGGLTGCSKPRDTDAARIEQNLRLQNEEIWSKGNFDLVPILYTENYVGHFPGGETIHGRGALREMVAAHRVAFPNWHEEVLEVIVDGNRAATFYRSQGTQKGDFIGLPASSRGIDILEASIYRMEDGKIAEQWAFPDILSLRQQLAPDSGKSLGLPASVNQVWNQEDELGRLAAAGELEAYRSLFHDKFIGWPCGMEHPARKASVGEWVREVRDKGIKVTSSELTREGAEDFGNFVVVHYRASDVTTHPDGHTEGEGEEYRITHTWMRTGDAWQIIGGMCALLHESPK